MILGNLTPKLVTFVRETLVGLGQKFLGGFNASEILPDDLFSACNGKGVHAYFFGILLSTLVRKSPQPSHCPPKSAKALNDLSEILSALPGERCDGNHV